MTGNGFRGGEGEQKKKKKKFKFRRKEPQEYEDPTTRDHMLAGAYGGVVKPKARRPGVKKTINLAGGMLDLKHGPM